MDIIRKISLAILMSFAAAGMSHAQSDGLKIHHLGMNHSLIKVEQPKTYILLPVEESAPEATVNVLVNNRIDQTFYVRLAVNRVDYLVPFALGRYDGEALTFDVHTHNNRANVRDVKADACWNEIRLSDTFDKANREKYRPAYHHTPEYAWMNDPNGMFYKDGVWHLCYQYNPYGSMWGNMNWGHSTSRDLVNWEHHPIVIEPNGLGTVFSGSSVVDKNNTAGFGKDVVLAFYTSAGASQMQSLAYSTDGGYTFEVYKNNPIITSDKESRDPKVFWHEESGKWIMLLAAALEREMWIYSSPDAKNWTKESAFGKGYGEQEGVWECPDLVKLPVRGTDKSKWVLICNINPGGPFGGSATQYFVGEFDGKNFICDTKPEVTKWMDFGKDHYATVSWSNAPEGRHTVVAWMSNWQYANNVPTQQFRSANSIPRDLDLFVDEDGTYSVGVLPSVEMESLRSDKPMKYGSFTAASKPVVRKLPAENDGICEIEVELAMRNAAKVNLTLANAKGNEVVMTYDASADTFAMDRTRSGIVDFSRDFPTVTVAPLQTDGKLVLRMYIDRCSIEAFDGQGRFAMTNLVFPEEPYSTIAVSSEDGSCKVHRIMVYPLDAN